MADPNHSPCVSIHSWVVSFSVFIYFIKSLYLSKYLELSPKKKGEGETETVGNLKTNKVLEQILFIITTKPTSCWNSLFSTPTYCSCVNYTNGTTQRCWLYRRHLPPHSLLVVLSGQVSGHYHSQVCYMLHRTLVYSSLCNHYETSSICVIHTTHYYPYVSNS